MFYFTCDRSFNAATIHARIYDGRPRLGIRTFHCSIIISPSLVSSTRARRSLLADIYFSAVRTVLFDVISVVRFKK